MEADLIAVEDDSVTFSRDGRTNNCPRANLSEEDQRYIQEWQAERSKPSVVADEFRN